MLFRSVPFTAEELCAWVGVGDAVVGFGAGVFAALVGVVAFLVAVAFFVGVADFVSTGVASTLVGVGTGLLPALFRFGALKCGGVINRTAPKPPIVPALINKPLRIICSLFYTL